MDQKEMKPSNSNFFEIQGIFINVLIKDKKFRIYCGDGRQKMRWLADCAIYKYDALQENKISCGPAKGIKLEDGSRCDLNDLISTTLSSNSNVLILLKEDESNSDENNQNEGELLYNEEISQTLDDKE